jgi:hypothetical protein
MQWYRPDSTDTCPRPDAFDGLDDASGRRSAGHGGTIEAVR